ncbi:pantetheine-phosphate adenylyltransferase [Streptococcus himalayensis]|uniref:Phosphopantetheine adenylyltransferase n=1 Tax=Streptococcus himalayensis TaxID=1888195 RepID=A0A917A8V6_9STRE|nr:pantetheine-phosphate adenylyltransferase [Streptococcus himalayensis]GGE35501.1 phosphopantetheine adenylyltransferase [Streptococcus himalayensis]
MHDKIGLFTGSFDPITNGHVELIERACRLFDTLYVGLFYNQAKSALFSLEKRERMLRQSLAHLDNVHVLVSQDELAVDVARRLEVTCFVRGLRNGQDLEYEQELAFFNRELAPDVETMFLLPSPFVRHLSSSRVRELLAFGQDVSAYVPMSVVKELEYEQKEEQ